MKNTEVDITIVPPQIMDVTFEIQALSPYLSNKMDKEEIRAWRQEKEQKKARKPKPILSGEEQANKGLHLNEKNDVCIPGIAFKNSMVSACRYNELPMVKAKGLIRVTQELIPIQYSDKILREDIVNEPPGPRGAPQLRYRWEFHNWSCSLPVRFDGNNISVEQIANILAQAGFNVGVGDWRPDKGGDHGMFEVAGGSDGKTKD